MKPRFTKGQTIYQIHSNWKYEYDNTTDTSTYYMKITEEVVESCGQKRLLIYNDGHRCFRQYTPNQKEGLVSGMFTTFHPNLIEAEAEMEKYIAQHNNVVQGTRTILIRKMF